MRFRVERPTIRIAGTYWLGGPESCREPGVITYRGRNGKSKLRRGVLSLPFIQPRITCRIDKLFDRKKHYYAY